MVTHFQCQQSLKPKRLEEYVHSCKAWTAAKFPYQQNCLRWQQKVSDKVCHGKVCHVSRTQWIQELKESLPLTSSNPFSLWDSPCLNHPHAFISPVCFFTIILFLKIYICIQNTYPLLLLNGDIELHKEKISVTFDALRKADLSRQKSFTCMVSDISQWKMQKTAEGSFWTLPSWQKILRVKISTQSLCASISQSSFNCRPVYQWHKCLTHDERFIPLMAYPPHWHSLIQTSTLVNIIWDLIFLSHGRHYFYQLF